MNMTLTAVGDIVRIPTTAAPSLAFYIAKCADRLFAVARSFDDVAGSSVKNGATHQQDASSC